MGSPGSITGGSSPSSGSPAASRAAFATATTSGLAEPRASEIFSWPAAFSARVLRALSGVAALAAVSTACGRPTSSPHSGSVKPHREYSGSSVTLGSVTSDDSFQEGVLLDDGDGQGLVSHVVEQDRHPVLLVSHHHALAPLRVAHVAVHREQFLGLGHRLLRGARDAVVAVAAVLLELLAE